MYFLGVWVGKAFKHLAWKLLCISLLWVVVVCTKKLHQHDCKPPTWKFNKDSIDEFQTESFNCFALMINYYYCRCIPEVGKSHTIANMKDPYIHLSCWWICSDIRWIWYYESLWHERSVTLDLEENFLLIFLWSRIGMQKIVSWFLEWILSVFVSIVLLLVQCL